MSKNNLKGSVSADTVETLKRHSQWSNIWKRLRRNKLAMLGMVIVFALILMAVFADIIAPYHYSEQDHAARFVMPCLEHPLGTDSYGRDLLSRIIYGGRISLLVSLMSVAISVCVGSFLGAVAGYYGGWVEEGIMRVMDVIMAVPSTLLAVCLSAMLGGGVWQTALAISIAGVPMACRMLRATVLTIREQEYVEATLAAGSSDLRLIFKHIVPNCIAPIIVDTTLRLGGNILAISGLSFIGLGVQPPTPEWGQILNSGRMYIRDYWPLCVFPGLSIMLTMFGFNMFGDGLRDALDPKLKR